MRILVNDEGIGKAIFSPQDIRALATANPGSSRVVLDVEVEHLSDAAIIEAANG